MRPARACLATVLLACLAGAPAARAAERRLDPARVAAVMALGDPAADDWPVEVRAAAVERQLGRLADALARGASAVRALPRDVIADDATADRWSSDPPLGAGSAGGFRLWSTEPGPSGGRLPARDALAELARVFGPSPPARFRLEVAGVEAGVAGALCTRTVLDCSGQGPSGPLQGAGELVIDWASTTAEAEPAIVSVALAHLQWADRPEPLFVDGTGAVLSASAGWYEELGRGAEYWHGRLDAVHQPPLLGHHGLAVGDADGDGLEDLYLAQGEGLPNHLLLQNPDGTVREGSAAAGVDWLDDTAGVLFADMDNDGDQDLLSAIGPSIVVAKNDGKGRFDRLIASRAPAGSLFQTLAVADYDLDGDLDVFGTCQARSRFGQGVPVPLNGAANGPFNRLLRNDGGDRYLDVTEQAGLFVHGGRFSFGAAWGDYDRDGDPDLFVSNAAGPDSLYRNDAGHFVDVAEQAGVADLGAGAGASFADYDLDGRLDLYVTGTFSGAGLRVAGQAPFLPTSSEAARAELRALARGGSLFAGRGDGTFGDHSDRAGARGTGSGFGGRFVDLNGDNLDDLVIPQGFLSGAAGVRGDVASLFWRQVANRSPTPADASGEQGGDYQSAWAAMARLAAEGRSWAGHQPSLALLNRGDGRFADVSHPAGLGQTDDGRAVASVDWDGDGDLDLWLANRRGPRLRFLRGTLRERGRHFVAFLLQGTQCNRDAIGASVELRLGGREIVRTVAGGDGFLSHSSRWLHFGLEGAEPLDRVRIRWPGGAIEELRGVAVDRRLVVRQGDGKAVTRKRRSPRIPAAPFVAPAPAPDGFRVLLKVPLPLPPTLRRLGDAQAAEGRARLYLFWDPLAAASVDHLVDLAPHAADLRSAGVDVIALSAGPPESTARAAEVFSQRVAPRMGQANFRSEAAGPDALRVLEVLLRHLLDVAAVPEWPVGLLADAGADLQTVHIGPVPAGAWPGAATLLDPGLPASRRSLLGGRWYYRTSRDLLALSQALKAIELREDARHYLAIHQLGPNQKTGGR